MKKQTLDHLWIIGHSLSLSLSAFFVFALVESESERGGWFTNYSPRPSIMVPKSSPTHSIVCVWTKRLRSFVIVWLWEGNVIVTQIRMLDTRVLNSVTVQILMVMARYSSYFYTFQNAGHSCTTLEKWSPLDPVPTPVKTMRGRRKQSQLCANPMATASYNWQLQQRWAAHTVAIVGGTPTKTSAAMV